jgi:hypothetical protein
MFLDDLVAFARGHGVVVDEAVVLRDRSNLLVHLTPAPVVARIPAVTAIVRSDAAVNLAREIDVTDWLAAAGAAVVGASPELPPGVHSIAGRPVSFRRFVAHHGAATADAVAVASAVCALHEALLDCPIRLPLLSPITSDLGAAIDALGSTHDVAEVRGAHNTFVAELGAAVAGVPQQVLHGDCHRRNLLVTETGLVWNDFEDTCRGPLEWDLAVMDLADRSPLAELMRAGRSLQSRVWSTLFDRHSGSPS